MVDHHSAIDVDRCGRRIAGRKAALLGLAKTALGIGNRQAIGRFLPSLLDLLKLYQGGVDLLASSLELSSQIVARSLRVGMRVAECLVVLVILLVGLFVQSIKLLLKLLFDR